MRVRQSPTYLHGFGRANDRDAGGENGPILPPPLPQPDNPTGKPWYGPGYTGYIASTDSIFEIIAKDIIHGVAKVGTTIVRTVSSAVGAVGSAIEFVGGGLPSPRDYEPENLAVTAWTDPPKFALLAVCAGIVFPPALVYMASYQPPNIVGLTAGLAEAAARGGTDRVISKILNPIFDHLQEQATALIDYALNGNAALVRWALKKIAQRLPDDTAKAIILAIAESSDEIVNVIRDINALRTEDFWAGLGQSIENVSQKFGDPNLKAILLATGAALKGGSTSITILVNKGVEGVHDAIESLKTQVLGLPPGFEDLDLPAKIQIARSKVEAGAGSPIVLLGALASGVYDGVTNLEAAARRLPGRLGDTLSNLIGLLAQVAEAVNTFIQQLLALAQEPLPTVPPPSDTTGPAPVPAPTPQPTKAKPMNLTKLLMIAGGGVAGFLLGGPVGGAVGAGAGALLPSGSGVKTPARVLPVTGAYWDNGVERQGTGVVLAIDPTKVKPGDALTFPATGETFVIDHIYVGDSGVEVHVGKAGLRASTHGAPTEVIVIAS